MTHIYVCIFKLEQKLQITYILSGAENPSTSMQVSRISFVSIKRLM